MKVDRKKLVKAIESVIYNGVSDGEEIDITTNNIMIVVEPLILAVEFQMQPEWLHDAKIELINGEYYHCAFQNRLSNNNFVYQGVFKYKDGFIDENQYPLRPTPSHYIHIPQPPTK